MPCQWAACTGREKTTEFDARLFGKSNAHSKTAAFETALTAEGSDGWS